MRNCFSFKVKCSNMVRFDIPTSGTREFIIR